MRRLLFVLAVVTISTALMGASGGGCGAEPKSCGSSAYACGPGDGPAGGPRCCSNGYNCCFGYNVCCDEAHPFYYNGKCWQRDPGGGTICGKPAG